MSPGCPSHWRPVADDARLQRTRDLSLVGQGRRGIPPGRLRHRVDIRRVRRHRRPAGYRSAALAIALLVGVPAPLLQRRLLHANSAASATAGSSSAGADGRRFESSGCCASLVHPAPRISDRRRLHPGLDPTFDGEFLSTPAGSIPVLGDTSTIENALEITAADIVAVGAVEHLGIKGHEVVVAELPASTCSWWCLADVAGPRLRPPRQHPDVPHHPAHREGYHAFAKAGVQP